MSVENAAYDFKFLLDRRYTRKSSLNLISTRYSLRDKQRNFLFRKVFSEKEIRDHRKKMIPLKEIKDKEIVIDAYNVLITTEEILSDGDLVEGMDGFLRDFKGVFSAYKFDERTKEALKEILKLLRKFKPKSVLFVLDSQISRSGDLAKHIREELRKFQLTGDAKTENAADSFIKNRDNITITSDTAIIEKVSKVADLSMEIYKNRRIT